MIIIFYQIWVTGSQRTLINLKTSTVSLNAYLLCAVTEKELQKLYKNFSKIDKDKSGLLEPEEFFDIPGKNNDFLTQIKSLRKTLW